MKCKDCKYLTIDKPDDMNEGHAYCSKYNVASILVGKSAYKKKIDKLQCYAEVGKADVTELE